MLRMDEQRIGEPRRRPCACTRPSRGGHRAPTPPEGGRGGWRRSATRLDPQT